MITLSFASIDPEFIEFGSGKARANFAIFGIVVDRSISLADIHTRATYSNYYYFIISLKHRLKIRKVTLTIFY